MNQPTPLDPANTLYGAPLSLYTGRARSYLIKAGIPYRETMPITEHYIKRVAPAAGGRQSMATLELPDGGVIRDGVAINALAQPFRFYLLKRVQDEFESLDKQQQDEVTSLLDACQMANILEMKLSREIGRQNNLEVWL